MLLWGVRRSPNVAKSPPTAPGTVPGWYHSPLLVATGGGCWPRAQAGFSAGMPRMLPSAELLPLQRAPSPLRARLSKGRAEKAAKTPNRTENAPKLRRAVPTKPAQLPPHRGPLGLPPPRTHGTGPGDPRGLRSRVLSPKAPAPGPRSPPAPPGRAPAAAAALRARLRALPAAATAPGAAILPRRGAGRECRRRPHPLAERGRGA